MSVPMTVSARLKASIATYIALAVAFIFSLCTTWNEIFSREWETPVVFFILGLLLSYDVCHKIYVRPTGPQGVQDSFAAWIVLILFFLLALLPLNIDLSWCQCWCLWLLLIAPLWFSSGRRVTLYAAIPLFVFCVFIPMHNEIMLAVSHPLRIIATAISGLILRLLGFNVSTTLTVLKLENVDLAVTDACSGIQQFEALLLLGYILVKRQQKQLLWRIVHYSFCIPSVILANAIRLVLVVILYRWPVGEAVLYSGWHEGLGYLQVLLAVLIMWAAGSLLTYASHPLRGKGNEG